MADKYTYMTTAELQADADQRTPPVDLSGAANNPERAQLLRDADAAQPPIPEPASAAVAAPTPAAEPPPDDGGVAGAGDQDGPPVRETAPYTDDADLRHRLGAAAGDPVVDRPLDDVDIPAVGGGIGG